MNNTLETVAAHFSAWRKSNGGKRYKIPETLWQEACSLSGQHSWGIIAKTMRLMIQKDHFLFICNELTTMS
jgi:hypothetical protein